MRNLFILVKTHFMNAFNLKNLLKINKVKLFSYVVLAILLVSSLFMTTFDYAKSAAAFFKQYNMMPLLIVMFFVAASFSIFMFTIFNAKSNMFNANDNDLLLAMPIKPSTILASRLIYIIIWNLGISLVIMISAFVVYAMNVKVSILFYLCAFILIIFLPIIPIILASIIGYIIAYFTTKSNYKNWFELIATFVFIGLFYYAMGNANNILNFIVTHVQNIEEFLKWVFYPAYLVIEMFRDSNYLSLIIFILINIGLFVIFTYLLSTNFKKIIAKLQENKTKSNYVVKNLKTKSVLKLLYLKEFKRYISSPVYVLNTCFGVLMILVAAVASIFYDANQILKVLEIDNTNNMFSLLLVGIIFITFLSCTTSATISLEGKNYWILKTLPLPASKTFTGKLLLNISLVLPATYISLIILYFTLNLSFAELIVLILIATLATFVSAQFGLLVNLKFPKMDAVSDIQIVKRSVSVMISVLVPIVIILGCSKIYSIVEKILSINMLIVIIAILLLILNLLERYLLNTWGTRRFKEIN